jgi:HD-GYP domain-containing protein (c-di-GMP phosphodiesterase class II)
VIDSFDAMTSHRPYRHQVGEAAADPAIVELESGRGTRYWPDAVNAFARLYRTGHLGWILHHFNDASEINGYCGGVTVHEIERSKRRGA